MHLINKAGVRQFLLRYAKDNKAHKFTRVSDEAIQAAEYHLNKFLRATVEQQPSKGKTIYPI